MLLNDTNPAHVNAAIVTLDVLAKPSRCHLSVGVAESLHGVSNELLVDLTTDDVPVSYDVVQQKTVQRVWRQQWLPNIAARIDTENTHAEHKWFTQNRINESNTIVPFLESMKAFYTQPVFSINQRLTRSLLI